MCVMCVCKLSMLCTYVWFECTLCSVCMYACYVCNEGYACKCLGMTCYVCTVWLTGMVHMLM